MAPQYDYECCDCKNVFEEHVKLEDYNKNVKCPKCNSPNTKRQIAAVKSYRISGDNAASTTPRRFRA
jgi:putative FmdB family regulatory protein